MTITEKVHAYDDSLRDFRRVQEWINRKRNGADTAGTHFDAEYYAQQSDRHARKVQAALRQLLDIPMTYRPE